MYRDPTLIKKHATRVRLDDHMDRQIEAICDFTGQQKAVVMRELVKIGLSKFHEGNVSSVRCGVEGLLPATN